VGAGTFSQELRPTHRLRRPLNWPSCPGRPDTMSKWTFRLGGSKNHREMRKARFHGRIHSWKWSRH